MAAQRVEAECAYLMRRYPDRYLEASASIKRSLGSSTVTVTLVCSSRHRMFVENWVRVAVAKVSAMVGSTFPPGVALTVTVDKLPNRKGNWMPCPEQE